MYQFSKSFTIPKTLLNKRHNLGVNKLELNASNFKKNKKSIVETMPYNLTLR